MVAKAASVQLEQARELRIERNRAELDTLVPPVAMAGSKSKAGSGGKRKKAEEGGTRQARRSSRARKEVDYSDDKIGTELFLREEKRPAAPRVSYAPPASSSAADFVSARSYPDSSKVKRDSKGALVFDDEPDFRPNLAPQQVNYRRGARALVHGGESDCLCVCVCV